MTLKSVTGPFPQFPKLNSVEYKRKELRGLCPLKGGWGQQILKWPLETKVFRFPSREKSQTSEAYGRGTSGRPS